MATGPINIITMGVSEEMLGFPPPLLPPPPLLTNYEIPNYRIMKIIYCAISWAKLF